jgi:hypothetical protein
LWSDYSAPKKGNATVSLDSVQTGLYDFSIQAFDGSLQHTLSIGKPIYIKQPNAPQKLGNVKAGSIDGEMFASWDNPFTGSFLVTLYDHETLEVLSSEFVSQSFYLFDQSFDKVKFSVSSVDGNDYGEFDVFEIVRSTPSGAVSFPDIKTTRESVISMRFDCASGETGGLYLDGAILIENQPSGDYDLHLSEGEHEVIAFIKDSYGNMKTLQKTVTVDKTPPQVTLSNPDEVKTSSENLVVDGKTEPNAVIAINGVEQELGDGAFMAKLALSNGVNPISVTAYDTAGNKGVKTITAERSSSLAYWPLLPLLILLAAWYICLNIKGKGAKPK